MLFKAIYHGKEHRTPYTNKRFRRSGITVLSEFSHNPKTEDPWTRDNRLYKNQKRAQSSKLQLKNYLYG